MSRCASRLLLLACLFISACEGCGSPATDTADAGDGDTPGDANVDASSDAASDAASDGAEDASPDADATVDVEICGDLEIDPGEVCDDGNMASGDGCSMDCTTVEPNAVCPPIGPCEYCGDGIIRTGDAPLADEQCDDGNAAADDGCSASCQREGSYQCPNPGELCELCGNGRNEPNEQCDDGGYCIASGGAVGARCTDASDCGNGETCQPRGSDGCNLTCTGVEEFWTCDGPADGLDVCTRCGDGTVNVAAGEICDDGGRCTGDDTTACVADADCAGAGGTCQPRTADGCTLCQQIDFGYVCPPGGGACARCGVGVITPGLEQCDDANAFAGDGCTPFSNDGDATNDCRIVAGFHCENEVGTATAPDTRFCYSCGDGVRQQGEACDDGNQVAGDGCGYVADANLTNDCFVEANYTCFGALTQRSACNDCGNGELEGLEVCDNDQGGTCSGLPSQVCTTDAECAGVGFCQGVADDGCAATCASVETDFRCVDVAGTNTCFECGDGHLDAATGEVCDDGDNDGGDGCNASCFEENGWSCVENGSGDFVGCSRCGDGIVQLPIEGCDDRNGVTGDGCNACAVESTEWTCTYNITTFAHLGCADCGDGIVRSGIETCDDANEATGDGCNGTCQLEDASQTDWTCTYSTALMRTVCNRCGDGVIQGPTEVCDDGDESGTDGCSATCKRLEPGYTCATGPTNGMGQHDASNPTTVCYQCGNGIIEAGQTCDDGDAFGGDGCSSTCQLEPGYYGCYNLTGDAIPETCLRCGDGRISTGIAASGTFPAVNETCDDGNTAPDDGCDDMCMTEGGGYNCFVPGQPCVRCGNSIVSVGEGCDDGNFDADDGCSAACQVEPLWNCQNFFTATPMSSICSLCGDGAKTGLESCDDGNRQAGDGCSGTCSIEPGYVCTGANCAASLCGDGVRAGTEECDDGNTLSNDCCNANCRLEDESEIWSSVPIVGFPYGRCVATVCGDGIVQGAETCDTSGISDAGCVSCRITPGYTCTSTACTTTACGNGAIQGGEQCECDGMGCFYNDGTTRTALTAAVTCTGCVVLDAGGGLPSCGNGVINSVLSGMTYVVEACDDGNAVSGDGCSATCTVEPFYVCEDVAGSGGAGSCDVGLSFVEVRRFNLSMVQADSLYYDPTTRSFVGMKRVASGQVPLELCLDGTVEYPTNRPRPNVAGAGSTFDGSVYDPATGRVYFLIEETSNNYSIGWLPRSSLDENDPALSLSGVSALYQGPVGGTNRVTQAGDMTIGEDGNLYVNVGDTANSRWLVFASDGNTPRSFVTTSAIDVIPAPTNSGRTSGFAAAWYVPGWDVFASFADFQYAPAATYDVQGSRTVFAFWRYTDGTNDGGFIDDYYTQSYLYNATAPIGNGPLFSYLLTPPLDMDRAGQAGATATDGSGFVVCLATGGAGCRLFALACDPTSGDGNQTCQGNSPGTTCVPSGGGAPANVGYCTRQAGANDDYAEFEAVQTATPIDVLANDVVGEGACYNNAKMVVAIGTACYMGTCTPGNVVDAPIAGATVTIGAGGTNITYIPPANTCGYVDTFTYWARLGNSSQTTPYYDYATVTVVVGCDCGDGIVQSNEQCDPMAPGNVYACDAATCRIIPSCGNGIIEPGEACDDDNTANGDGCDGACQLEYACGDGLVDPAFEGCDDGNTVSGDGCGATCQTEECGDGITQVGLGEQCDDDNTASGDGCDGDCLLEPVCGNSIVEGSEECDDGTSNGNDRGCLANCTVAWCGDAYVRTNVEECDIGIPAQASTCTFMCTVNTCGDGVLFGAETCDPGEAGTSFACRDDSAGLLACQLAYCGDGTVDASSDVDGDPYTNDVVAETCDDANTVPGDGCRADCSRPTCGDGIVDADAYVSPGVTFIEECDDGNQATDDGCLPSCRVPYCGDGFVTVGEECDVALPPGPNGCNEACQIPNYCGDGELGGSETCDYGAANGTASSACSGECVLAYCGDGDENAASDPDRNPFTTGGVFAEQCDDGGTTSGDGCSNVCVDEWVCGDGNVDPGEACDDGNTMGSDGCSGCVGLACRDTLVGGFTGCQTEMICGDGVLQPQQSEQCDDGNMSSGDGCSASCVSEFCGDGTTQLGIGEECDQGSNNGMTGFTCTASCRTALCGNGRVESPYETCDDGNTNDDDGCSSTCQYEIIIE